MSAGAILRHSFDDLNQHLRFIFLDLVWRSIWLACSALAFTVFGLGILAHLGSLEWSGPDLGPGNPIILVTALREFWSAYGATLIAELGLLVLSVFLLWIVLEALFRGGRQGFWMYVGTSIGRILLLSGISGFFVVLSTKDQTGGTLLIGAVVLLGVWFIVSCLEAAIRKNALSVIAADFPKMLAVLGTLFVAEVFIGFVLWGSAIAALTATAGMAVAVVVAFFWMVLHSYLIALRFSAIDIIRNAVGE